MKTTNYFRLISVMLAAACICSTATAQEDNFDLQSQRSEAQYVNAVTGKKINHRGFVLNPTPQAILFTEKGYLDVSGGVRYKFKKEMKYPAFPLKESRKGVKLSIDYGADDAERNGVKAVSGAYAMNITAKDIKIYGYDERGVFYALQTLKQLAQCESFKDGRLPSMIINDYPALPNRGVVEGFYGEPWSHEVRLSLIDFYGKMKMNSYVYGPKDDPYHSSPNWRLPYPEKEEQNIRELIEACNRNYVDFVWAIHPGKDIKWNDEDYHHLLHKFHIMHELGVRHFALFFDDISGEGTNPYKQTELLNKLTEDFVNYWGDVSPLTVCPTDYSRLWANPTENGSLAIYGRTLDPGIKVFWTGDVVCSDLTRGTLEFINSRIKRPAYYWWNFPVTDYARHILMQGPVYGLDTSLTDKETCGILSNPMEHGEASKLALYGVADYAWNPKMYNALDNWERGIEMLVPEAADAYRTFAIHSADTETGYRRDESWETATFSLNRWDDEKAMKLENEFKKIKGVPEILRSRCENKALIREIDPWLTEFQKLGVRGEAAVQLGRMFLKGNDDEAFWNKYVENIMNTGERKAYEAHKSGTLRLQPFYENMMDDMAHLFLKKLSGKTPCDYIGIGSFPNSGTILTKLMLDGDTATHYTSAMSQRPNDWIGIDLRDVRDVKEIEILQGRNSVDDVDYFDHVMLECSEDGRKWTTLMDDMQRQYVINWKGSPVKARYVRLRRLESSKRNYAAVRSFKVNPIRINNLGFSLTADNATEALNAFDNSLGTACRLNGKLSFGTKSGCRYIILSSKPESNLKCIQKDKDGRTVSESELKGAYSEIAPLSEKTAEICIEGKADIYEIITIGK